MREKLVVSFQTPIHPENQVKSKDEKKYSNFSEERLKRAFHAAILLEEEINNWAADQADKRQEKFRALYYTLNTARPNFREALIDGDKNQHDIVRMKKEDFLSEETLKRQKSM